MAEYTMVAKDAQGFVLCILQPGTTKEYGDKVELDWRGPVTQAGVACMVEVRRNSFKLPDVSIDPRVVTLSNTFIASIRYEGLPSDDYIVPASTGAARRCTCGTQSVGGLCADYCDLVRTDAV